MNGYFSDQVKVAEWDDAQKDFELMVQGNQDFYAKFTFHSKRMQKEALSGWWKQLCREGTADQYTVEDFFPAGRAGTEFI